MSKKKIYNCYNQCISYCLQFQFSWSTWLLQLATSILSVFSYFLSVFSLHHKLPITSQTASSTTNHIANYIINQRSHHTLHHLRIISHIIIAATNQLSHLSHILLVGYHIYHMPLVEKY